MILLTAKTASPQCNRTRRGNTPLSGLIVIHTAENVTDFAGFDPGAENVLAWIKRRPDPGSYHRLCDADSTLRLAPWDAETFHDRNTNRHSIGLSAAVAAADWPRLYKIAHEGHPSRGHAIIDRLAFEAADAIRHIKKTRGITVPIRLIDRLAAHAGRPGFIGHGMSDPGRRTDPGPAFDWTYLFDRVRHHLGQTETPTTPPATTATLLEKVTAMEATHIIFEHDNGLSIANILAGTWTRVSSPEELEARKAVLERTGAKVEYWQKFKTNGRDSKADPAAFGVEVKK